MTRLEVDSSLTSWILDQGLGARDLGPLVEGLCHRLAEHGLSIWRMHVSMATLHPTLTAFGGTWWRESGYRAEEFGRAEQSEDRWRHSPIRALLEGDVTRMRRRLQGPDASLDFPVLREFRDGGGTDWVARIVPFGSPDSSGLPGIVLSVVSDRSGGFADAEIAAIDRLLPALALACYRITLQHVAENLLAAYLGADAGQRVLAGQIERGAATEVDAVVFLADCRGFTGLADVTRSERLLPALNEFLGDVTDIVEAHGGQVLKFMGDGLLAIFSLGDDDAPAVCGQAIAAARAAIEGNRARNDARRAADDLPMELDIALYLGRLMYGNVGSARRLDFTVIGPAVNEASRIEALCEPLGCRILASASFAATCGQELQPVGKHRLRGVAEPQQLFTLASRHE